MKLFFQEYGQGAPMVILHGLLGSLDNWHSLSRKFGELYRVFALDQRNHGRSPHSAEMTYQAMSADLLEFLDEHRLSSVILLGHSMGGKTAMEFALQHPEHVKTLIVVDIAPRIYPPHHEHIFEALFSLDLHAFNSRSAIDNALAGSIPNPSIRQFLMKNLRRGEQNAFHWKANLPALHGNMDELNRSIVSSSPYRGPVLSIRGLRSDYVSEEDLPALRQLFPAAQFRSLDTGHWVHAEAPAELFKIVVDFLRRPH